MQERYPYKFTFEVQALANGTQKSATIQLDKGVDFVAESISYEVLEVLTGIKEADKQLPLVLVNFKNSQSDAGIFDKPAPLTAVAGSGENPHVLNMPVRFKGNTSPIMEAQNISSDKTYARVFVTLHGYREYEVN